jgi:hypothetical protein
MWQLLYGFSISFSLEIIVSRWYTSDKLDSGISSNGWPPGMRRMGFVGFEFLKVVIMKSTIF